MSSSDLELLNELKTPSYEDYKRYHYPTKKEYENLPNTLAFKLGMGISYFFDVLVNGDVDASDINNRIRIANRTPEEKAAELAKYYDTDNYRIPEFTPSIQYTPPSNGQSGSVYVRGRYDTGYIASSSSQQSQVFNPKTKSVRRRPTTNTKNLDVFKYYNKKMWNANKKMNYQKLSDPFMQQMHDDLYSSYGVSLSYAQIWYNLPEWTDGCMDGYNYDDSYYRLRNHISIMFKPDKDYYRTRSLEKKARDAKRRK